MKSFCIIGLGRFGQALAVSLLKTGHQVMIIDDHEDVVAPLADYVTNAVIGDPTNETLLKTSGAAEYDCVVLSTSKNINNNILMTLILKDLGAKYIVVRANSDLESRVLEKVGADRIVFPEREMGEKLAGMLEQDNVLDRLQFSDEYSIVEIPTPAAWVGKSLIELAVRTNYEVNIVGVTGIDGKMDISPDPNAPFREGQNIAIIGENRNIEKLLHKNS